MAALTSCVACSHHVTARFFDGGEQPLATLGWPRTLEEALAMERLPLDFVRCVACGHVFNASFDERKVPYAAHPTLMYNRGALWTRFLRERLARIAEVLPRGALVVELGHGDGGFLRELANLRPDARFVGFDLHGVEVRDGPLELRRARLDMGALTALAPALLVARHVLEHLAAPLALLQRVAHARREQTVFVEVPCIDRVIEGGRTSDFFYEHCSHFTTRSFLAMLERAGASSGVEHGHGYDDEVIYALATLRAPSAAIEDEANRFAERATRALASVRAELAELARDKRVAVWGGTGKSAAFIARYGLDRERFPIVVDSDTTKVGTFVAGTGQLIRAPSFLIDEPAHVILVPPQWRARDIVIEMRAIGIVCERVLIEHQGALVDFERGEHPYARSSTMQ